MDDEAHPGAAYLRQQLVNQIVRATHQASGRAYRIEWDTLPVESLQEILRLMRDLEHEQRVAVNRARMMPWRR